MKEAPSHEGVGWPSFAASLDGVDSVGERFRIGKDVSVFRTGNVHPSAGIHVGNDVMLFDRVRLLLCDADTRLTIGNRVTVNVDAYLSGEAGLHIGDDVLIGARAMLLSAGHEIDGGETVVARNLIIGAQITVGRGAWIGAGAIVLPGVSVGEGAVVGAGSVVTHDVPPMGIVAGNPARLIRMRNEPGGEHQAEVVTYGGLGRLFRMILGQNR